MRLRNCLAACFWALAAFPILAFAEDSSKAPEPSIVVRLKSIDGLLADIKYLGLARRKDGRGQATQRNHRESAGQGRLGRHRVGHEEAVLPLWRRLAGCDQQFRRAAFARGQ